MNNEKRVEDYEEWRKKKNEVNNNYPQERADWELNQAKSCKKCDCGAEKCKTTHATYCSKFKPLKG